MPDISMDVTKSNAMLSTNPEKVWSSLGGIGALNKYKRYPDATEAVLLVAMLTCRISPLGLMTGKINGADEAGATTLEKIYGSTLDGRLNVTVEACSKRKTPKLR